MRGLEVMRIFSGSSRVQQQWDLERHADNVIGVERNKARLLVEDRAELEGGGHNNVGKWHVRYNNGYATCNLPLPSYALL